MNLKNPQDNDPGMEQPSRGFAAEMLTHLRVSIVATVVTLVIVSGIYPAIVWGLAQALFHHQANGSLVKSDGTPTNDDSHAVGSTMLGQPFTDARYFHPRPSAAGNSPGTATSSYSSAGGYDPTSSGGTNFGPTNDELINGLTLSPTPPATQPAESLLYDGVRLRTIHYAVDNHITFNWYKLNPDGSKTLLPLPNQFEDAQHKLIASDITLVDAFPHNGSTTSGVIADDFSTPIPADAVTASASGLDPHISPANAELQKQRVADARKISPADVEALIMASTEGPALGFLGDPGVNLLKLNLALDSKYPLSPSPATQPTPR